LNDLLGVRVGFAVTGSHCTLSSILPVMDELVLRGAELFPIASERAARADTRFGPAGEWLEKMARIAGREVWTTIQEVEPIGPKKLLDIVVVAPCTGNTLGKLANGITDTSVTMAVKAHLRNGRPVVIGVSTNDALSGNARNLGVLLSARGYYFIPFGQDDPWEKPASCVAKWELTCDAVMAALRGRQVQPVICAV